MVELYATTNRLLPWLNCPPRFYRDFFVTTRENSHRSPWLWVKEDMYMQPTPNTEKRHFTYTLWREKPSAKLSIIAKKYATFVITWLERSFFISNSLFSANMASLFRIIVSRFFNSSSKASMACFLFKTFSTSLSNHWRRCSSFTCSSLGKKKEQAFCEQKRFHARFYFQNANFQVKYELYQSFFLHFKFVVINSPETWPVRTEKESPFGLATNITGKVLRTRYKTMKTFISRLRSLSINEVNRLKGWVIFGRSTSRLTLAELKRRSQSLQRLRVVKV